MFHSTTERPCENPTSQTSIRHFVLQFEDGCRPLYNSIINQTLASNNSKRPQNEHCCYIIPFSMLIQKILNKNGKFSSSDSNSVIFSLKLIFSFFKGGIHTQSVTLNVNMTFGGGGYYLDVKHVAK